MEITSRRVGDVTILDLDGKLIIGKGDVRLRGALLEELDDDRKKVLINLEKVKVIDSSGLGELMRCKTTAEGKGAEVRLLNVDLKARKLLTMAQLVGILTMYDDEGQALADFSG